MSGAARRRPVLDVSGRVLGVILGILFIGVPVALLLMAYDVLPPQDVQSATGYGGLMSALQDVAGSGVTGARIWVGVAAAVVAAGALALLAVIAFYRPGTAQATVQSDPGRETVIKGRALKHLAEGAARSAGAVDPDIELRSHGHRYDVLCRCNLTAFGQVGTVTGRIRERILSELTETGIELRSVEVTAADFDASTARRERVS